MGKHGVQTPAVDVMSEATCKNLALKYILFGTITDLRLTSKQYISILRTYREVLHVHGASSDHPSLIHLVTNLYVEIPEKALYDMR